MSTSTSTILYSTWKLRYAGTVVLYLDLFCGYSTDTVLYSYEYCSVLHLVIFIRPEYSYCTVLHLDIYPHCDEYRTVLYLDTDSHEVPVQYDTVLYLDRLEY